jgi:hypothetical protein
MTIKITTEEYDMMGLIDRDLLNLLYNQGYITLEHVIEIVRESKLDLDEESILKYSENCIVLLQKRFLENVECALFSLRSDETRLLISEDAKWVFDQIMQEEYDEEGEVVAKVLPDFDMEEYI